MSFNEEQLAHMRYLATIPLEMRCKCGWDALFECLNRECVADARGRPAYNRIAEDEKTGRCRLLRYSEPSRCVLIAVGSREACVAASRLLAPENDT